MKKLLAAITVMLMLFSFTACESSSDQNGSTNTSSPAGANGTNSTSSQKEENKPSETGGDSQQENQDNKDSKILIAYFSRWGNTDFPSDVDATTSASIVTDNKRFGTTEYVARMIQEETGGDIHLIETASKYTADYDELISVNHDEMAEGFLPELKETDLDISKYDTVFVGYPVWATNVPRAVVSFLSKYDFSDKKVIPFCTHAGYGAGKSYSTIAEASKAKDTAEGLAIEAENVPSSKETVKAWLDSVGIAKAQSVNSEMTGNTETAIKVTVGDTVLDGVMYDTALAKEIMGYFPLTVSMVGYIGREYYGGVDFYPENLEGGQRNFENGDITYCQPHHNMAIFYAQTDKPTLSVDVIPIGKITSDLSVFESFDSTETVIFSLAD